MLIYAENITPRLRYVAEVFFGECGFTSSPTRFYESPAPKINYSAKRFSEEEFHIQPSGLLNETSIRTQSIVINRWNDLKTFFPVKGDLPFDIFSASFYLLSRYEEYLPHRKDSYGRYAHDESLAFKEGFISIPLVNLWMQHFFRLLQEKFDSYATPQQRFRFVPTYDIDIAFAGEKGLWRKLFDAVRGVKTQRNGRDIFDVYDWLDELHRAHKVAPIYFFLLARRRSKYDRNISPRSHKLRALIRQTAKEYKIGVHPSWQSFFDEGALKDEIATLGHITQRSIDRSRQHYIRLTLPHTYRQLISAGITEDYSMGYGSINGFRASFAAPFFWYDLMNEETTSLVVHPFCFMEANSFFEQHLSADDAAKELDHYHDIVKQVSGELVTIFHNHFLTEEPQWEPWRRMYAAFLEKQSRQPIVTSPSLQEQS